jgi:hypothetical protein
MEHKDLLKNKQVLNALEQTRQTLNKRWFELTFFNREDKVWFFIEKK